MRQQSSLAKKYMPPDGGQHLETLMERIRPVEETRQKLKPSLSPYAQACEQYRSEVLRALSEEGTSNVDFLKKSDGTRNIGTHNLRPLAHMGETIIAEQPIPAHRPYLAENVPPETRAQELAALERWWEKFQKIRRNIQAILLN